MEEKRLSDYNYCMIDSIVITCKRPNGASYLIPTIGSACFAGFSPCFFYDGDDSEIMNLMPHRVYGGSDVRLGIVPTYRSALKAMHHSERFVVIQDDVILSKGLREWLESQELPDGVISLYSPNDGPDGWNEFDLTPTSDNPFPWLNGIGGCAMLFTREIAQSLLDQEPPVRTDRLGAWIGEFCYNHGVSLWLHNPSLVQHIGEQGYRGPATDQKQAKRFCEDVCELEAA
jgi:hypothetical protein